VASSREGSLTVRDALVLGKTPPLDRICRS
jgi:hypothetical protein